MLRFSGDIMQWPSFYVQFVAAVDNQYLPEIQKLSYLLSCLTRDAAVSVVGYAVFSDSIALSALKKKCGDKDAIRRQLYAELRKISKTEKGADVNGTIERLERIQRHLEALGERLDQPEIEMEIVPR